MKKAPEITVKEIDTKSNLGKGKYLVSAAKNVVVGNATSVPIIFNQKKNAFASVSQSRLLSSRFLKASLTAIIVILDPIFNINNVNDIPIMPKVM